MKKPLMQNNRQTKAITVAGLSGGSGKSVVSVGLTAAFAAKGRQVVPFKKGPDYIDAGWLKLAAGQNCYNLDQYLMDDEAVCSSFAARSQEGELAILEGNRGLYDGVNAMGGYSTAELSILLKIPVLLVVNCTKTTRTIAALVLGCQQLDGRVDIRGVVLNQVATQRQRKIITEAVEQATGIPVVGVIPRMKRDIFPMRHLGMVPHQEYDGKVEALEFLSKVVAENIDLEKVESLMEPVAVMEPSNPQPTEVEQQVTIGVLQDAAFQFYYSENLQALVAAGADLVQINALTEKRLPDLDGLYIGGGFPETSAAELAANKEFRDSVREAANNGLVIYAECGGLIYLGESIELDGKVYDLSGVFPVRFGMSKKPQAHGYSILEVEKQNGFYPVGSTIKGHEFRYSTILSYGGSTDELCLSMKRGTGFLDGRDGLSYKNTLAMYTHIHAGGTTEWAPAFVERCIQARKAVETDRQADRF